MFAGVRIKKLTEFRGLLNKIKVILTMSQNEKDNLGKVFVRNVLNEDRVQISFKYCNPVYGIQEEKLFNFNRLKSEELEKSLERMSINVSKEVYKKLSKSLKKKKNKTAAAVKTDGVKNYPVVEENDTSSSVIPSEENPLPIFLYSKDEALLDGSIFNDEAWRHGNYLEIGGKKFVVEFNFPTVKQVSLPQIIMSGYVIVPKVTFEFSNVEDSKFKWFVEKQTKDNENDSSNAKKFKVNQTQSGGQIAHEDWLLASEEFTFTPSDEHKNGFIKFSCLPQEGPRVGEEISFISKSRVADGPKDCPFEKRHKFTQDLCKDDRLVFQYLNPSINQILFLIISYSHN